MRKFLSLLAVLGLFLTASAQTKPVTGRVTDPTGTPIVNASILIRGTHSGTTSDPQGNFKLSAKRGDVLVISAIGYGASEIKVGATNDYAVQLTAGNKVMDEVIVTAGGIKSKRREIGTANTVVKADALNAGKAINVASGLQGKVAGLNISGTSSGVNPNYRIILRGQRSMTGNNQALIVLDNVIVPNSVLGNLNPSDVEEVVVLNGSGAAALYGSQASNGAIIVTTKKGKKGVAQMNVANTTTIESVAFYPKLQTKFGAGGTAYGLDAKGDPLFNYLENQSYGPAFDGVKRPLGPPLQDGSQDSAYYQYNPGHLNFWQKGVTNQTDVSLTNGDDNSTFYLSGQYATITGTTPGDKYNRATLRVNGTRRISDKLNIAYTSAYTQNRYDITTQTAAMYGNMLNMPSNVDITRYKDWRNNKFANPNGYYNPWYLNPYFSADNYRSKQRTDQLTANVEIRYTPIAGLDLVGRQGIATRNFSNKNTVGAFKYTDYAKQTDQSSKSDIPAQVNDGSSYVTELLSDAFIQYNKKFGDFSLNAIGGGQWRQDESKYVNITANGLVVPNLYNVSNGVGTPVVGEQDYKARQIGAYGDIRLGYKNFLFLHGTGRNDWVSILAPKNRSFFYPSADLSFIATEALGFLKESQTISFLKFRGGWSKVGQVNLGYTTGNTPDFGAYYLDPTISPNTNGFPYGSLAGYTVDNTLISKDLKPEMTKQYEFGFDLNLFKDRFVSTVTYYSSKTDNQTVNTSISGTTGFTNLRTNTGQTQSSGVEVTAHYTALRTADWNITVGGNYTYLENKVNSINTSLPYLSLSQYANGSGSYAIAGYAFPTIQGYDYVRDPAGHPIVDGVTGLPTKTSTIVKLGNAQATNRMSLDASVTFRHFHLSALFEYRWGYKVYNSMGTELDWSGTGYRTAVYNRKSFIFPNSVIADPNKPGNYIKNTSASIANGNGNNGFWTDDINRGVTSNYVTSGDFWKLREIALSYDVPKNLLQRTKTIKAMTISVQARNLCMWLAKDNLYTDPEYSDAGNDNNGIGLTGLSQTPPSRFYGATLSVTF